MPTTTIRLPDELKARIAHAAAMAGTTSHNFIMEAIAEKTTQAEQRAEFISVAHARYANIVETDKTIPWKDMQRYLIDRMANKKPLLPVAKKLGR